MGKKKTKTTPTEGNLAEGPNGTPAPGTGTATMDAPPAEGAPAPATPAPDGSAPVTAANVVHYRPSWKLEELTQAQQAAIHASRDALTQATANAKPGEALQLDPRHVLIVGIDLPADKDDPLNNPIRVAAPIVPQWVNLMETIGAPGQTIVAIERDGYLVTVNGRQRIKHLRPANEARTSKGLARFMIGVGVVSIAGDFDLAALDAALDSYRIEETASQKAARAKSLFDMAKKAGQSDQNAREAVALAMNGVSGQAVSDWLKFATAPAAIVKAVDNGDNGMTMTAALQLLRLESIQQQVQAMKDLVEAGDTSVKAAKAHVKALLGDGDEGEGKAGGGGKAGGTRGTQKGPGEPDYVPGSGKPPKKRFVNKVLARALEKEETPDVVLAVRVARWILDGEAAPKCLSGDIRAVLAADSKDEE
jgi:hypothetical protein